MVTVDTIVVGLVIVEVSMGNVMLPVKVGGADDVVEEVEFVEVAEEVVELVDTKVVVVVTLADAVMEVEVEVVLPEVMVVDDTPDEVVFVRMVEVVVFDGNIEVDVIVEVAFAIVVEVALVSPAVNNTAYVGRSFHYQTRQGQVSLTSIVCTGRSRNRCSRSQISCQCSICISVIR